MNQRPAFDPAADSAQSTSPEANSTSPQAETATGYYAFLLRLWCDSDQSSWHASLQAPDLERIGFSDLDALVAFLRSLVAPGKLE